MRSRNNLASHWKWGAALKKYWILYLFIGLFGLLSVVFGVYPMLSSIFYSFFKTNTVLTKPEFVGLGNYLKLFQDSYFWDSLRVTLLFTVICVPLNLVAALALAQLLNYHGLSSPARLLFKLAVFIPFITPDVVSAVVWKQFFNSNGAMNSLLKLLGIPPQSWLTSGGLAIVVLAFVELWKHVGLYTIIFLTNYQLIDRSMYEAATTDGANGWQMYRYITLPSLRPALMLNLVYAVIQFMKTYTVSRIITFGGPNYATNFLSYYAYSKYEKMDFGMSTAIATFLFLLIIGLTFAGSWGRRRFNESK
ncbi:carbohydrate ABC transporter permease [Lacrimispora indolis]|uniref:carbohydrate ABC transporter permease n=1 Tax=Lacrimispora indolis TaxID=69825 RepID=UPI00041C60F2|nr:sugar ABC transporter permease [[Clostridium] methoxybenzovorans]